MKRRRMSALQRKYFGKRRKTVTRRKVVYVARRRRGRRAYTRGIRRYGRRAGVGMKGMLAPIIGGVADNVIDSYSPIDGLGAVAVGMFMHNSTLKDIGLYKVGFSAGNFLPIPRGSSGTGGGFT